MKNKPGVIVIEGHVQGLANTRALGQVDIPVIIVDKNNCIARYSKYCKGFYQCPDFQSEAFIEFLINLAEKKNLIGWSLIPSNDHIVFNLSQNLERIQKYFKTLTPPPDQLINIYNKQKLLEAAEIISVPHPKTFYPHTSGLIDFNLKFPVITKGKYGLTFYKIFGRKVYFAKNIKQLQSQLELIDDKGDLNTVLVQEIIPDEGNNKTISYTAFCVNGDVKTHWMGQKLREHPWTFGTATFAESIYNNEVKDYSEKLLKKLNYSGVCEVEFLYHSKEKKYMLIEINPRTWLWTGLAKANGIDYACYIYNYLNGVDTDYPKSYEAGLKWRNLWTDSVFSTYAMFQGKLNPIKYFKSLNGNMIDAVRSKDDPKPFRAMTRMLLLFAWRR